jgi:predicted AAA+ superfamily ATPase
MKREIITTLQHWIQQSGRKPLVLRGARQVGKTWLARHLAHLENKQLIELNFEREPRLLSLFEINEPKQILNRLAQHFGLRIIPNEALLFLDEIQRVPELLGKLRWFAEDMPELAVIAAGSLLDFALEEYEFSMPVGRIQYLYIEPLSFEEFLMALNQMPLVEFLREYQLNQPIPEIMHEKLLHYVREYTFVGGLPAAVEKWAQTSDIMEVYIEQSALVTTYQDDFAKYRKRLSLDRLEDIWNATPKMLGKQWKYSQINRTVQSASLKLALHLLKLAQICHPIYACNADALPLSAGIKEKIFKVLLLDIGLVSAALGLQGYSTDGFLLTNEGGLTEQFVFTLLAKFIDFCL